MTVDGETRKLGFPFIVIATQNPIETAGTYQLPEAQLDRFLLQISMGYPKQNEELEIIKRFMTDSPLESLSAVCNADDVKGMVKEAEGVHVDEAIMNYIVDIADKTRNNINIAIGVSTRGVINMVKAVKAYAYINGRNYVVPEDVFNPCDSCICSQNFTFSRNIRLSTQRRCYEGSYRTVQSAYRRLEQIKKDWRQNAYNSNVAGCRCRVYGTQKNICCIMV